MSKVFIRLKDKIKGTESNETSIEDLIYNQDEIEFEFPYAEFLPYKDFLFYRDDYEVIVRILGGNKDE